MPERLNYADVVKGNALSSTPSAPPAEVAHEAEQQQAGHEEQSQTASTPAGGMSASAKPYIPSYLAAALKAPAPHVILESAPQRLSERPKMEAWYCSTVSNSVMDHESTSSWADDDESFLLSVAKSQKAMQVAVQQQQQHTDSPHSADSPPHGGKGRAERLGQAGAGNASAGSGGGSHGRRGNYEGGRGRHHGQQQAGRMRGGRGGGGGGSNSNYGGNTGGRQGGGAGRQGPPSNLSCGRFDVLMNPKVMRHL